MTHFQCPPSWAAANLIGFTAYYAAAVKLLEIKY